MKDVLDKRLKVEVYITDSDTGQKMVDGGNSKIDSDDEIQSG